MKQKDLLESVKVDNEQEDFDEESEYSSWKKDRGQDFGSDASKRSLKPYLFLGAGLILLIVLLILFFPTGRSSQSANEFKMLEGRVKNIEDRLFALEGIEKKVAQMEQKIADLTKTAERAPAPWGVVHDGMREISRCSPPPSAWGPHWCAWASRRAFSGPQGRRSNAMRNSWKSSLGSSACWGTRWQRQERSGGFWESVE